MRSRKPACGYQITQELIEKSACAPGVRKSHELVGLDLATEELLRLGDGFGMRMVEEPRRNQWQEPVWRFQCPLGCDLVAREGCCEPERHAAYYDALEQGAEPMEWRGDERRR